MGTHAIARPHELFLLRMQLKHFSSDHESCDEALVQRWLLLSDVHFSSSAVCGGLDLENGWRCCGWVVIIRQMQTSPAEENKPETCDYCTV